MAPSGKVRTIAGLDLFEFGDRDGVGTAARLQHPLGIAHHGGLLYVADTYNNKIKQIDPSTREVRTWLGSGEAGHRDGTSPLFDEPGGLSATSTHLYIADTNNHVIRTADLKTGRVTTLQLKGLWRLRTPAPSAQIPILSIELPEQTVQPGSIQAVISLDLPAGFKLTPRAPSKVSLAASRQTVQFENGQNRTVAEFSELPVQIPVKIPEGKQTLKAEFMVYYCETGKEALCYFKEFQLVLPVLAESKARSNSLQISYRIK